MQTGSLDKLGGDVGVDETCMAAVPDTPLHRRAKIHAEA